MSHSLENGSVSPTTEDNSVQSVAANPTTPIFTVTPDLGSTLSKKIEIQVPDNSLMLDLLGERDEFLRVVEDNFESKILARGNQIMIEGREASQTARVIRELILILQQGQHLEAVMVQRAITMVRENHSPSVVLTDRVVTTYRGKPVRPKTSGQKRYIDAIRKNMVTFGIGPAGTGKSWLAVACAVQALQAKEVERILLTRPAVEAGERLGFLPGDLMSKVDPYLRPLYDALQDMVGAEGLAKMLEKNTVEVAPLAFMRGRTLNDSFIILDEAQNTTPEQMKMFLTRIGFNSKVVVTGDVTQVDISGGRSGLMGTQRILSGVKGMGFVTLGSKDVVRHRIVQDIVDAYELHETKQAR